MSASPPLQSRHHTSESVPEVQLVYDSAPIGLAFLSTDCRYLMINQRLTEICDISVGNHIGRSIRETVPQVADQVEQIVQGILRTGEPITGIEINGQRVDGSNKDRVWITYWHPVKDRVGQIVGINVAAEEISERKRAEAREKMLMAELDHRVKNILAQVSAIAKSTREGSRSVDEFLQSLDGRIQSLAAAHTLLVQSDWQGVGVDALVRSQLAPYASGTNITISGAEVILGAAEMQVLTRVLHELGTNAAKYGALSIPGGRLLVSWDCVTNEKERNLVFVWRELGGPPAPSKIKASYGTNLIRNLIPHELGGTVDFVFAAEGVNCRIEIPLRQA